LVWPNRVANRYRGGRKHEADSVMWGLFAQVMILGVGLCCLRMSARQVIEEKKKALKRTGIILVAVSSAIMLLAMLVWIVQFSGMVNRWSWISN
jgi:hypothetical protein